MPPENNHETGLTMTIEWLITDSGHEQTCETLERVEAVTWNVKDRLNQPPDSQLAAGSSR